ncbi:hypothetical protein C0Q70_00110 [Pomacea canaliculata]|uniref:Uncharacterized protein n=1 Tax=Pomacea canaliculata TaxID=400727 RepID=A0A2T7PVQ4_POMCA|nr:hypothetical protein C0Q70_00110 [Pomacea canaliculata]
MVVLALALGGMASVPQLALCLLLPLRVLYATYPLSTCRIRPRRGCCCRRPGITWCLHLHLVVRHWCRQLALCLLLPLRVLYGTYPLSTCRISTAAGLLLSPPRQ